MPTKIAPESMSNLLINLVFFGLPIYVRRRMVANKSMGTAMDRAMEMGTAKGTAT